MVSAGSGNIEEILDCTVVTDRGQIGTGEAVYFRVERLGRPFTAADTRWNRFVWGQYMDVQQHVFRPDDMLHPNACIPELQNPDKTPYAISGIAVPSRKGLTVVAFTITDIVTLSSGLRHGFNFYSPTPQKGLEGAFLTKSGWPLITNYLSDRVQTEMSEALGSQPLILFGDDAVNPYWAEYGKRNGFVAFRSGIPVPSLSAQGKLLDVEAGKANLFIRPNAMHRTSVSVEDAVEIVRNYQASGFGTPNNGRLVRQAEEIIRGSSSGGQFVYEGMRPLAEKP